MYARIRILEGVIGERANRPVRLFDLIDLTYLTYLTYLIDWVSQEGKG